jgi:class 3 adenylate cyclase
MADSSREARSTLRKLQHDLRTPLGQILGYAEILEEDARDAGNDPLVPDIHRIQGAARDLLRLVDGIFEPHAADASSAPGEVGDHVPERTSSVRSREPREALAGARILLVDDDAANRDLLARRIGAHGPAVRFASNGREALHLMESVAFDLVLLDLMMPEMGGIETLTRLRQTRSAAELPVIVVTALESRDDVVAALTAGANDYVTKPVDLPIVLARIETQLELRRANEALASAAQELSIRNAFIRRMFGRYVSDDIVDSLLEQPEGVEFAGERRTVTILTSDLRGFSLLAEALDPLELVWLLNTYLGAMADKVHEFGGTVDEFIGDAVLAFFGAPIRARDDAERAVACARAMQSAMIEINREIRERGLPEISMGIGIATGEVVVGSVGSERRSKYTAVGSTVNLAARIESFTLGGEIWICDSTHARVASCAPIELGREVHPKGFERPLRIHRVASPFTESRRAVEWRRLPSAEPVGVSILDGKSVNRERHEARITAIRVNEVELAPALPVRELDELLIQLGDGESAPSGFAKVTAVEPDCVRAIFTAPADELKTWLEALPRADRC